MKSGRDIVSEGTPHCSLGLGGTTLGQRGSNKLVPHLLYMSQQYNPVSGGLQVPLGVVLNLADMLAISGRLTRWGTLAW